MKKRRDDIIKGDPVYEGETFQSLAIEHLHTICREALEQCQVICQPLGRRFGNLRSVKALDQRSEIDWLTDCLERYFTKRWGDYRREASKPKKVTHSCDQCKNVLRCIHCEEIETRVFLSLALSSKRDSKTMLERIRHTRRLKQLPPFLLPALQTSASRLNLSRILSQLRATHPPSLLSTTLPPFPPLRATHPP
jgi:hypothetical protein